jgi:hypothetical protein
VSETHAEDETELLLPIKDAPAGDAVPPPDDDVPEDWLAQPDFDPAGRPI